MVRDGRGGQGPGDRDTQGLRVKAEWGLECNGLVVRERWEIGDQMWSG